MLVTTTLSAGWEPSPQHLGFMAQEEYLLIGLAEGKRMGFLSKFLVETQSFLFPYLKNYLS